MSEFPQRIVYVDDEQSVRFILREALERFDPELSVVTCGTGKELMSRLRELQPDIILLDLKMPSMSGPDIVSELRKRREGADIPIIFITGVGDVEMLAPYKDLGVLGVILKPFDVMKMIETIGAMWRDHLASKIPVES